MDVLVSRVETVTTTDGEIPTGFLFATVKNIGSIPIQVGGVTLEVGEAKSYPFVGKGQPPLLFVLGGGTLKFMFMI